VRNALARFSQVAFENDDARERARKRLLNAAKRFRIVPVGFITGQLQSERRHATAGRLVIELGRNAAPGELEARLRTVLRDPTLAVLHWSDAAGAYLDGAGKPVSLPAEGARRGVTYLERQGRPMTALVHDPKDRLRGRIEATSTDAAQLPTGFVTFLMTDIEASTELLQKVGDRYGGLLNEVRNVLRAALSRASGREIDARADEFFAVFERPTAAIDAAVAIQRQLTRVPIGSSDGLEVRVRVGIHSGRPTLTDVGYIGLAVHTAARVCSAAHGGQIIVSAATRAALATSAPIGVRFRSLGRHRLAGLPEPEMLFQLAAPGLRATFPRPRTGRPSARGRGSAKRRAGVDGQLELPQPPVRPEGTSTA
jgi:class 3 adenylate cyclase